LDVNSFWYNMISQGYNTTMAVSIIPQERDYEFYPGAPDVSGTSNTLMIGDYNRSEYIEPNSNQSLTVTSSAPNIWQFDLNLSFGYVNTTDQSQMTEYYTSMTNWTVGYDSALL